MDADRSQEHEDKGRVAKSFRRLNIIMFGKICKLQFFMLGDTCLVWGRDSCEYECNVAGTAGRPATCSLVPRLGYMYNARRNPRSLQYYSRVDVPSTVTPQQLREGDDLQERCVLGSRGVRPHPTNPPWLRP